MATQSRGTPYPAGSDANNTAADIQALALWVNDRPGVATLTTAQRNALTGVALWDGRVITNTTTDKIERYDLGLVTWVPIADASEIAALLATAGTPADLGLVASRGVSAFAAHADHVHAWPAGQAYTPTLTNATLGTGGTLSGRYTQQGKIVHFIARVRFGTGLAISGSITLSLPVARAAIGTPAHDYSANVQFLDAGSNNYLAFGYINATGVVCYVPGTNGALVSMSPTVPFTWAATDEVWVNGTYEAA